MLARYLVVYFPIVWRKEKSQKTCSLMCINDKTAIISFLCTGQWTHERNSNEQKRNENQISSAQEIISHFKIVHFFLIQKIFLNKFDNCIGETNCGF